jgi:hypothetical protein
MRATRHCGHIRFLPEIQRFAGTNENTTFTWPPGKLALWVQKGYIREGEWNTNTAKVMYQMEFAGSKQNWDQTPDVYACDGENDADEMGTSACLCNIVFDNKLIVNKSCPCPNHYSTA